MTVHEEHTFLQTEKLQPRAYPTQLRTAAPRHKPLQAQGFAQEGLVAPSPSFFHGALCPGPIQRWLQPEATGTMSLVEVFHLHGHVTPRVDYIHGKDNKMF